MSDAVAGIGGAASAPAVSVEGSPWSMNGGGIRRTVGAGSEEAAAGTRTESEAATLDGGVVPQLRAETYTSGGSTASTTAITTGRRFESICFQVLTVAVHLCDTARMGGAIRVWSR